MDLLSQLLNLVGIKTYSKPVSPATVESAPKDVEALSVQPDPTDKEVSPVSLAMVAASQPSIIHAIKSDQTVPSRMKPSELDIPIRWNGYPDVVPPADNAADVSADNPRSVGSDGARFLNKQIPAIFSPGPYAKNWTNQ